VESHKRQLRMVLSKHSISVGSMTRRRTACMWPIAAMVLALTLLAGCVSSAPPPSSSSTAPGSSTLPPDGGLSENAESWKNLEIQPSPDPRYGAQLLADPTSDGLLLVGGMVPIAEAAGWTGEAWALDPDDRAWLDRTPPDPLGFDSTLSEAVTDLTRDSILVVLLGVEGSLIPGEGTEVMKTYEWRSGEKSWHRISTPQSPSYRIGGHSMAYLEGDRRALLFGGYSAGNDLWVFDSEAANWARAQAAGAHPPSRQEASFVYDPVHERAYLFGGLGDGMLRDLWSYDPANNAWTELSPAGPLPTPRMSASMVAFEGKLVLFGGTTEVSLPPARGGPFEGVLGDTWVYDPDSNAWTQLDIPGPPPRAHAAMAYHGPTRQAILYGGYGADGYLGDTWAFKLGGGPGFTHLRQVLLVEGRH